jgi:tetratricopeptide (TPR) repeat protein
LKLKQKIFVSILFFGLVNINSSISQTYNFDSLKETISENEGTEREIDLLVEISENYNNINTDSALNFAKIALDKAVNLDYESGIINSLQTISYIYLLKSDFINSLKFAKESLEKSENLNEIELQAESKLLIAVIYAESGNLTLSTKYNFESLKLYEEIKNNIQIETIYGNIGADYLAQSNYEKALEYMFKALKLAEEINDTLGLAYQYNNIGLIYANNMNDNEKALYYYNEALKINTLKKNHYLKGINFTNIATVFQENQNYDSALIYNLEALQIFEKLKSNDQISNCYNFIGEIYFQLNNFEYSIKYSLKSLELAENNNLLEMKKNASDILYKSYFQLKDTISAYKYYLISDISEDSLITIQNQLEIAKIELQYNIEKENQKIIALKKKRTFLILFSFTILIILFLIVITLLLKQKNKADNIFFEKQKIQSHLEFKNKELTVNILSLTKNKENINDLTDKLIDFKKKLTEASLKKNLNNIILDLNSFSDDNILEELNVRFNEANKDFYNNLLKNYPELTQNDLKLCALLRLNMTTKDISQITGQRLTTIENARYRLRKKIGISNSEINLTTLLSQI